MAALFIIAKNWKKPKWPSLSDCINKWWYIHTIEYYTGVKRSKLLIHKLTWMDLKDISILSERIRSQKITYCLIPLMRHSGKDKL